MSWQAERPFAVAESLRTIALEDRVVPYVLRRARRKTIGLSIDRRGLRVGAPQSASLAEIEALIRRHGDWVRRHLDRWRERRPEALKIEDGGVLEVLGAPFRIRLAPGDNRHRWDETAMPPQLELYPRSPAETGQVLKKALRDQAARLFAERLALYAARLGLPLPRLALSDARTRWGSCNAKTGIRLNWRLIHFPLPVVDYVVIHELAHLREMNHSPRFWRIVEQFCPDYRRRREELKTLASALRGEMH